MNIIAAEICFYFTYLTDKPKGYAMAIATPVLTSPLTPFPVPPPTLLTNDSSHICAVLCTFLFSALDYQPYFGYYPEPQV